jgi:multidrug efflux pump subunit AcrB
MPSERTDRRFRGPIAWMVGNRVAPNLLMAIALIAGPFLATKIRQEVFPPFELDMVRVSVAYPGAGPEEVEQGIVLSIEESLRGLDGVKQVSASSSEGRAVVEAELYGPDDRETVYQEIKQEVDRIRTLPEDAEEPDVTLVTGRREVLQIEIYGDVSEWTLRTVAEQVRDRLLQEPEITQVELRGARRVEVQVEVPLANLRAYGLTLNDVARRISVTSREIPGGSIETRGGEILLRVAERKDWAREFEDIPIISTPAGTTLRLGDIGTVRDGFEDTDRVATYNGVPSIGLAVHRVGEQTPVGVATAAREAMHRIEADLPPGVSYTVNNDRSIIYQQRLRLLLKNAFLGLVLVLLFLGAFLEFRLAFWVTLGIPISFLGTFLFLPAMDVSINMVSMFAFIVSLGVVVDDAIIAGENIYEYRSRGMPPAEAAVRGAQDVALPISFSIATNIVAFIPLAMIPGVIGKIWIVIPMVVIVVFIISWVESLFILPSHLAHVRPRRSGPISSKIHARQEQFASAFKRFVEHVYRPALTSCMRNRYVTAATAAAILIALVGYTASGRLGIIFMPRVETDVAVARAVLPVGSPLESMIGIRDALTAAGSKVIEENGGDELARGVFVLINENKVNVTIYLNDPDIRPLSTTEVVKAWRDEVGPLSGLETLNFVSDYGGPGSGASLAVELSHRDVAILERASADLAERLAEFANVRDVDDGFAQGKQQFDFTLKPEGHALGLTVNELARQVRNSFYGAEALRQQRGRDEVRLLVRLPDAERTSEFDLEQLMIRTPSGRDVPLPYVADFERRRADTVIERRDGRRTIEVTANVVPIADTGRVQAALDTAVLPALAKDYPGLAYGYEGRQADRRESADSLLTGFLLALLVIYALLVIPFGSYLQPLVVMVAIPFGMAGAVIGHMIMGFELSVVSFMGMIALSGIVVNDALVLIDYANRRCREGIPAFEAMRVAGVRRFRPILLTTLTTFGGLAPMIFETSMQARFLVPMAISIGTGVIFATMVTLVLVPSLYLIVEDVAGLFSRPGEPGPLTGDAASSERHAV